MFLFFLDSVDTIKGLLLVFVAVVLPFLALGWVIYSLAFKKKSSSFSITDINEPRK